MIRKKATILAINPLSKAVLKRKGRGRMEWVTGGGGCKTSVTLSTTKVKKKKRFFQRFQAM